MSEWDYDATEKDNLITHSRYIIDRTMSPHPIFASLLKSVIERRDDDKVKILIPIF